LPEVYYWHARSSEAAAINDTAIHGYETYVSIRANARPEDKLLADARARLTKLRSLE